jgi:predicted transcriptional regulator
MITGVAKYDPNYANLETLDDISQVLLRNINLTPGIRYRELSRITGLNNGVLTYHLSILEKLDRIKVDRQRNRMTRYYTVNIPLEESYIIGQFRNSVARQLIIFVADHDLCTFNEIVEYIKKAASTVSWHLKRLKDAGLITTIYGERFQLYKVTNREGVMKILGKYKESFVDRVIDNYSSIIDKL